MRKHLPDLFEEVPDLLNDLVSSNLKELSYYSISFSFLVYFWGKLSKTKSIWNRLRSCHLRF